MFTVFRRVVLSFALALSLTSAVAVPASAQTNGGGVVAEAAAALDRLEATGRLSAGDRAAILAVPALAAQVVDPDRVEVGGGPVDSGSATTADRGCAIHWAFIRGFTLLGFVAYRWNHEVHWCYDGSSVTSVHYRSSWVTEKDSQYYFRNKIRDEIIGVLPASYIGSVAQASIDNCVAKYGCIFNYTPWVQHHLHGNGHWYYTNGH